MRRKLELQEHRVHSRPLLKQHHGAINLDDLIDQIEDLELNTIAIDWVAHLY
jgi:hypothetical protein